MIEAGTSVGETAKTPDLIEFLNIAGSIADRLIHSGMREH